MSGSSCMPGNVSIPLYAFYVAYTDLYITHACMHACLCAYMQFKAAVY